jgi:hypothetical protein
MITEAASTIAEDEDLGDCQGQAKLIKTLEVRMQSVHKLCICYHIFTTNS